ncbi:hypothetical protein TCAL_08785 [Tigriopus californicus]|uniref:Uncharacterized protein n=1 Tax=Tigriopus californicus TaxID=6832 RepID=A0A553PG44_TIGCA|nr:transcription factor SOX-9-like [Tigriopus californicus]TRY76643.1 hypothetical protein TCAL_08785 [Tigriopus californicus]|eukprot:TCALIF_08785-PA protein Name:"Protein of unknown function" AED:0.00 eAED:0.00 QI:133/1/1/1/0/0/2/220/313
MFKLTLVACAIAACAAQQAAVDPKAAKILKEQRFNAGDGRAGTAFATEDGLVFREETDVDGNRVGQYSYIGDNGQTYTVKYSAGTDGFRILSGDHIRATGLDAAPYNAQEAGIENVEQQEQAQFQPQPQPQPQPQLRAQPQPQPQAQAQPIQRTSIPAIPQAPAQRQQFVEEAPAGNPFINPHDPTHRNFQFNKNAAKFDPENPNTRQANLVPDCADCAGVNPFINPFDASHQQGAGVLAGHLAGQGATVRAQPPRRPAPRPAPAAALSPVQALPQQSRFEADPTTVAPRHIFPPGQLKLNRFENGFNFDFES